MTDAPVPISIPTIFSLFGSNFNKSWYQVGYRNLEKGGGLPQSIEYNLIVAELEDINYPPVYQILGQNRVLAGLLSQPESLSDRSNPL
jgi:hypothetical protein